MDEAREIAGYLRECSVASLLFVEVRKALRERGYWRNRPRGNPSSKNFGETFRKGGIIRYKGSDPNDVSSWEL